MPAKAYVCLGAFPLGSVTLTSSGGSVTVQPSQFPAAHVGGVVPVSITATASGRGTLELRMYSRGELALHRTVALVVADQAHWHFEKVS